MPNYDYECENCRSKTEVFHKIEEDCPLKSCPKCNKTNTLKKSVTHVYIGTVERSMLKRTGPRAGEGGLPRHWDEYDNKAKSSVREYVNEVEVSTPQGKEKLVHQWPQFGHDDKKKQAFSTKPEVEKKVRTGKLFNK